MSVGIFHLFALLALLLVASLTIWAAVAGSRFYPVMLGACAIACVALTASALALIPGWAARLEHFDVSWFEPTMQGRGDGGQLFAIYAYPYEVAIAGAVAAFLFARQLWLQRLENAPKRPPS